MDRAFEIKKKGSYTIELSLLSPVIISTLLFILFSSYYIHDRIIIEKACYISSLRAALCAQEDRRNEVAVESFEKEISGRLLGIWNVEIECDVNEESVIVTADGIMKMEEGLLNKILKNRIFGFHTNCKSEIVNEADYLRKRNKNVYRIL